MAETKKYNVGGFSLDVVEVKIVNKDEHFNEYELEDGSVIRVSSPVAVVYRVDAQKDAEGNPGYFVKNGTSLVVVNGPKNLQKKF
ncbi:hypothetical protein [Candidatus Binatus soli]|jgi:hypothetical protein|uniref:hypothetical protein n=1 Tax=Candidatus Binatus soli TaxID=1953413 RepID=UPI003D0B773E